MNGASNPEYDQETLELAFRESDLALQTLARWYEALDGKIVSVFSVASVIVGLAPTLTVLSHRAPSGVAWIVALAAWAVSAGACFVAFNPKEYRLDPNPKVLLNEQWLALHPYHYRHYRLEDLAESYRINRGAYNRKTRAFAVAVVATAVEVFALALALLWGL